MLVPSKTTLVGLRIINSPCASCACRRNHGSYITGVSEASTRSSLTLVGCSRSSYNTFFDVRRSVAAARYLATAQQSTTASTFPEPPSTFAPLTARKPDDEPTRSRIRDSLRAWSAQNDRIKAQSVPETIPYDGKIARLPNALFASEDDGPFVDEAEGELDSVEDGVDHGHGDLMRPGTLMSHVSQQVKRQTVVYLGDIGQQSLLLLEDGRWAAEKLSQKRASLSRLKHIAVPNFLTTEEVNNLLAHMPKQDVMRSAGEGLPSTYINVLGSLPDHVYGPVRGKLKAWLQEVQVFTRDHKQRMDQMYNSLALQDKWRRIRVADLPPLVLGMTFDSMSDAAKMAFISHCNTFHPLFVTLQKASSVDYLIGPKSLNETIRLVHDWARLYQEAAAQAAVGKDVSNLLRDNPLSSFIDRARRIILKSRKIRLPTKFGVLGSSIVGGDSRDLKKLPSGETFTSDDKRIIDYLWDMTVRRPIVNMGLAHASLIVRAVGAYPGVELGPNVVRMFLQEIGAINPWDRFYDLCLPLAGGPATAEVDELLELSLQSLKGDGTLATRFPDTMHHMRKDWAGLEAFCIDAKDSRNIEDAISVEPAASHPGAYWLHVHIAHPTAHLHPDHVIARLAQKRGTAFYSRNGVVKSQSMIPALMLTRFALRPDAPALTVSTLLDSEGTVHDIKVTPSIMRKVVSLDVAVLNHVMGLGEEEAILVVGDMPAPQYKQPPTDEELETVNRHLPSLRLMQRLLEARIKRRQTEVNTPANIPAALTVRNISVDSPAPPRTTQDLESYHWTCDPSITIKGPRKISLTVRAHEQRSRDVVTQSIRLASESLAKWLVDRQIPAIFIGNDPGGSSVEEVNKKGLNEMAALPTITRTSTPRPLAFHNIKQYVPCTSPMRKYMDMMNLYQIDSYLKAQADGLINENAPVQDESILAFCRTEVDQYVAEEIAPLDQIFAFSQRQDNDWFFQALFRAFHLKEANLPEIMEVLIKMPRHRDAQGQLQNATGILVPWLGDVELEASTQGFEDMAKYHNFIPVKILSVDPIGQKIIARAVGPPTEEQQNLDPILCYRQSDTDKSE